MRVISSLLAAALLLSACQAQLALGTRPVADAAARRTSPRPTPPAATKAAPAAKTAAAATKALSDVLMRPSEAVRALNGHVRLDAAYMLAAGAGKLIGADAASLVGADGGSLIGADGGSLIGADAASAVAVSGSPLVAAGAGNAIAPASLSADGSGLVGADGGSLIGADGGSLIGADGGSLIGADGGSLIGKGGNAYSLAQAPNGGLRAGQQLPAAGMLVAAVSLATGKPVSVGQDAAGKPVYAVYTNAEGGYAIYPPASVRGNLRIVVLAAGSADQRLRYGVLASENGTSERNVSEAATLAASYITLCVRQVFDGFLRESITTRAETAIAEIERLGVVDPGIAAMRRIERIGKEIGYETWPEEADRQALLRRMVDIGLSGIAFDELKSSSGAPAMPVLESSLTRGEAEIAGLMTTPPTGKTAVTVFDVPELNGYKILRPADYNEYVVRKIIAPDPLDTGRITQRINLLRLALGLDVSEARSSEFLDAAGGIANEIGTRMMSPDPVTGAQPTSDAIEAAMRAFVPSKR